MLSARNPETPQAAAIEARNLELLTFRDSALLLAFRFAGGRAEAEDICRRLI